MFSKLVLNPTLAMRAQSYYLVLKTFYYKLPADFIMPGYTILRTLLALLFITDYMEALRKPVSSKAPKVSATVIT